MGAPARWMPATEVTAETAMDTAGGAGLVRHYRGSGAWSGVCSPVSLWFKVEHLNLSAARYLRMITAALNPGYLRHPPSH